MPAREIRETSSEQCVNNPRRHTRASARARTRSHGSECNVRAWAEGIRPRAQRHPQVVEPVDRFSERSDLTSCRTLSSGPTAARALEPKGSTRTQNGNRSVQERVVLAHFVNISRVGKAVPRCGDGNDRVVNTVLDDTHSAKEDQRRPLSK